jgi:redox-sensitive bicupin YhaK (pirin superfamily)
MTLAVRTLEPLATPVRPRRVTHSTAGQAHGSIVRLVSPSDIGELIKPFVFLDYFEAEPAHAPAFGFHPHSGIATLTLLLNGQLSYEETTGVKGVIAPGGIEWMRAGGGVWHTGGAVGIEKIKGFQLWLALPPDLENGPAQSQYLGADEFQSHGPARVILGRHGDAVSKVPAPEGVTYLDVRLKAGERWRYEPPHDHTVAWIAVHRGGVIAPDKIVKGEIAVFEESNGAIEIEAQGDTGFVLGSAVKHPHDLVLGYYSVHTNPDALKKGEDNIARIGRELHVEGRLSRRPTAAR